MKDNNNPFQVPDDFDLQLLIKMSESNVRSAYVCSPLRAENEMELYQNMKVARFYMYQAYKKLGMLPRALHAYVIYDDAKPHERAMALRHGRELLSQCQLLLVCGRTVTSGMREEIRIAAELGMPIIVFCPLLKDEVRHIACSAGAENSLVQGSDKAPFLSFTSDELEIAI